MVDHRQRRLELKEQPVGFGDAVACPIHVLFRHAAVGPGGYRNGVLAMIVYDDQRDAGM
jgi:hypothetical protein